jgi:uncharacterized repeat protein (TIGR02543 family)
LLNVGQANRCSRGLSRRLMFSGLMMELRWFNLQLTKGTRRRRGERALLATLLFGLIGALMLPASPALAEVFTKITTPGDGWDVTFHPTNKNYAFFAHHKNSVLGCFYRLDPDGAGTGKEQGDGCFGKNDYTLDLGSQVGQRSSVWVTSEGNTAYVPLNSTDNANQRAIAKVNISNAEPANWAVATGTVDWAADMQYYSNSFIVDDVLYALSSTGWLTLDTDTDTAGSVAFAGAGPDQYAAIYHADDKLWAVSSDWYLHCYDLTTGFRCAGNGWTDGKSREAFNGGGANELAGVVEYRNTNGTFGGFCVIVQSDPLNYSCLNPQGVNDTTMVNPFAQFGGLAVFFACTGVLDCKVSRQHQVILHQFSLTVANAWDYHCWDYTTQAACSDFSATQDNSFAGQVYTIVQDPWDDNCFWSNAHDNIVGAWEISHGGGFATSGGECNVTGAAVTVTLIYDAQGGSGVPGNQTGNAGSNVTVSSTVPTRDGHTFIGWNTQADGSGTSYSGGDPYTLPNSGTDTLYAQWERVAARTPKPVPVLPALLLLLTSLLLTALGIRRFV